MYHVAASAIWTKIIDEWIEQKAVRQAIYNGTIRFFFSFVDTVCAKKSRSAVG